MNTLSTPQFAARSTLIVMGLLLIGGALLGSGCQTDSSSSNTTKNTLSLDVDEVLTDTTYLLRNQDGATVRFPNAFLGTPVLVGTIYTSCPNVCPRITGNMKAIRDQLPDSVRVQFVSLTFDPQRDTPSRLADYRERFGIETNSWQFLTADTTTIARLMDRLDVRYRIKGTERRVPRADTADSYMFTHSDQLTLIDAQGRIRAEYSGSQTPPQLVITDLRRLQKRVGSPSESKSE